MDLEKPTIPSVEVMEESKAKDNFNEQQGKEKNELADEISKRASEASEKVKNRVENTFLPDIIKNGDRAGFALSRMQNDFYLLVENPNDDCGGGHYEGWTPEEVEELYFVLYNEEL